MASRVSYKKESRSQNDALKNFCQIEKRIGGGRKLLVFAPILLLTLTNFHYSSPFSPGKILLLMHFRVTCCVVDATLQSIYTRIRVKLVNNFKKLSTAIILRMLIDIKEALFGEMY